MIEGEAEAQKAEEAEEVEPEVENNDGEDDMNVSAFDDVANIEKAEDFEVAADELKEIEEEYQRETGISLPEVKVQEIPSIIRTVEEEPTEPEDTSSFDSAKLETFAADLKQKREEAGDDAKSLLMAMKDIQKIKKKKDQLKYAKAMKDANDSAKQEKKDLKDERVSERERLAAEKTARQEAAAAAAENRDETKAANEQARKDALAAKKAAIATAKAARLAEREAKKSAKESKTAERESTADERAAKKVAADARKAANEARKQANEAAKAARQEDNQKNQQGLVKRKFKPKCSSIRETLQIQFSDSLENKLPNDLNKHCTEGVVGDLCHFEWVEDNVCGKTKPMFRKAISGNEEAQSQQPWAKLIKLECVEDPDSAGTTGFWHPTNWEDQETKEKTELEFGCGGCAWPTNEEFNSNVVDLGPDNNKSRARITAGRGADFECFDADSVQVWGTTVPVDGYCKLKCKTTQVPHINAKITCEADAVNDENRSLYNKLSKVNGQANQWKGLDKLYRFVTAEKYNNDELMQAKWSEEAAGENKTGWFCYKGVQAAYAEDWKEEMWSACNDRGWKSRSRACEGTCEDALQYKKCTVYDYIENVQGTK